MTTNTQNVLNRLERNPFYIYAETAFSHEGNLDYLYRLVDQVSLAQADGIKFQILMDPDESYTPEVRNGNDVLTWIFDADEWKKLLSYAHEKALDVVLLPIDLKATKFCAENTALYDFLEIHSINFNCRPLLEMADKIDKLLILGTGGRNLSDIEYALQILNRAYLEKRIIMMHGFQAFPSKKEDLRLGRIGKYQQLFDVKVGYADHTAHNSDDITMFQFAYLNGARIFEKHVVLEQGKERTDYQAAVEPAHLVTIREQLNDLITIQGNGRELCLSEDEWRYKLREKSIVALRTIQAGETFTDKNIAFKVSTHPSGLEQKDYERILGSTAGRTIHKNSSLQLNDAL